MARTPTGQDDDLAARALLEYLKRPGYRPLLQRELLHQTHVSKEERPRVRKLIGRLLADGSIEKIRGGRLVAAVAAGGVRGKLRRHREGFGFVLSEDGGEDLFIPPRHLGEGLSGDRVAARVTGRGGDGRLRGVVTEVLEPRGREVLALFRERGRGGLAQPFDPSIGESIRVPAAFRHDANDLDAVRVEVRRPPGEGRPAEGRVLERLGHVDESGTDVQVICAKYGLVGEFPEDVTAHAAGLPRRPSRAESAGRRRFDDPAPVTIDGETARDFDDAIAVEPHPSGGFRLFVHIADVAHFVTPSSPLDLEARRRGTSVYFPDRVLPMFPEGLSNELCSLRPRVDRLVQTAILEFDDAGRRTRVQFADGVIRSAARLTYGQVADALEERTGHGVPRALLPMLQCADRLRERLERRRHERGSIDFDLPEPQILLDVEGVMTGIRIEPRNRAHLLIEEFMLAANEAVAEYLSERDSPCMYRVHEPPDPAKLDALDRFVQGFGLRLRSGAGTVDAASIQALLQRFEGRPEYRVISHVVLRSMKQARYSPDNSGHFGLASAAYCHFTSPIRRYPDLVVHRLLRDKRNRRKSPLQDAPDALNGIARSSSELERNAESAERELLLWKKVAFVADKVGECFDGLVTGVTRFGLFVEFVDSLVEGLLHVERLGGERFEFDESRLELWGAVSGRRYKLGDRVRVRVDRVDRALLRVDLSPADEVKPESGAPRRRKSGPVRRRGRGRGRAR